MQQSRSRGQIYVLPEQCFWMEQFRLKTNQNPKLDWVTSFLGVFDEEITDGRPIQITEEPFLRLKLSVISREVTETENWAKTRDPVYSQVYHFFG